MNTPQKDDYFQTIVDPGDRASKYARDVCFRSHKNSDLITVIAHQPGNFRGAVGFVWNKKILEGMADYSVDGGGNVTDWNIAEEMENDSAGGKPQFSSFLGDVEAFGGLGWEIITMVADDFARTGRKPVVICNEVNAKRITDQNFHFFQAMMDGYGNALRAARLVNITGEVAITKHSTTAFCDSGDDGQLVILWGAACIGLCDKKKLIDGSDITPGLPVIGLFENGYRCNGGTFFTNVIMETWGPDIQNMLANQDARAFVKKLTVPSVSYSTFISELVGWDSANFGGKALPDIRGIAHITGGGIWGKFAEMLPRGVGANLHNMPNPPQVLIEAQELSQGTPFALSDWKAHGTLHGGCGMLMICAPGSEDVILEHAKKRGIGADVVGETVRSQASEVSIESRFFERGKLSSLHPE